ncbi:MAG: hypothetical protein K0U12_01495 [Gammaproteobacteria bacterium]|nr:hypothetical protein [Gammaproteobacteria bacterium]
MATESNQSSIIPEAKETVIGHEASEKRIMFSRLDIEALSNTFFKSFVVNAPSYFAWELRGEFYFEDFKLENTKSLCFNLLVLNNSLMRNLILNAYQAAAADTKINLLPTHRLLLEMLSTITNCPDLAKKVFDKAKEEKIYAMNSNLHHYRDFLLFAGQIILAMGNEINSDLKTAIMSFSSECFDVDLGAVRIGQFFSLLAMAMLKHAFVHVGEEELVDYESTGWVNGEYAIHELLKNRDALEFVIEKRPIEFTVENSDPDLLRKRIIHSLMANKNEPGHLTNDHSEGAKDSDSFLVVMARREKCFASWLITDLEKGKEASLTKEYFDDYPDQLIRIASKHRFFAEWACGKFPADSLDEDIKEDCTHGDACEGGWACVLKRTEAEAEAKLPDVESLIAESLSSEAPICEAAKTLVEQGLAATDKGFIEYLMQNYTAHQEKSLLVELASDYEKFNNYIAKIPYQFFIEWLFKLHFDNPDDMLWEERDLDDVVNFTAHQVRHFRLVSGLLIKDFLEHKEHSLLLRHNENRYVYEALAVRDQRFAEFLFFDSSAAPVLKEYRDIFWSGLDSTVLAHPGLNKRVLEAGLSPLPSFPPYVDDRAQYELNRKVWNARVSKIPLSIFASGETIPNQQCAASALEIFAQPASASASESAASISMDCS